MSHNYFDVYPKIKSGDIILWDFGILTPIIKRLTGEEYLRCGVVWRLPNGDISVLGTGLFSPMNFVKQLRKKTPFYWIPTNLEITSDVHRYALVVLSERPSLKERFKNFVSKISEGDFNSACIRFVTNTLYKGNFNGVILSAEYRLSELVRLMDAKKLSIVKVSKLRISYD